MVRGPRLLGSRWPLTAIAAATALLVVAVIAGCGGGGTSATREPGVISTRAGEVRGARTSTGWTYFGLPYAAPPVGAARWRPPGPAPAWSGVRDATTKGRPCPQGLPGDESIGATADENCLSLNLYVPDPPASSGSGRARATGASAAQGGSAATAPRPVMVFVHGGGFVGGTSTQYDGSTLASQGNVIVVTVNYRLGALGYLSTPELAAEPGNDAGTYALQDITAALRWLRSNVTAFGGDPDNVTLFGQSAGSANICSLLASPPAAGLFQRAIMESGPCTWPTATPAAAAVSAGTLAAKAGCAGQPDVVACLRRVPAGILVALAGAQPNILQDFPWPPVTGGPTLPTSVATAAAEGTVDKVPVILGTVDGEGRAFTTAWTSTRGALTVPAYVGVIQSTFGVFANAILATYPPGSAPPTELLARVITDKEFACPTYDSAVMFARAGLPVYLYEFSLDDVGPVGPGVERGASHGWELPFVMPTGPVDKLGAAWEPFAEQMIGYWSRFAATGNPNRTAVPDATAAELAGDGSVPVAGAGVGGDATGAVTWPAFSPRNPAMLALKPGDIHAGAAYAVRHHCDMW
jgi:para-nitrobenzyl esterase